MAKNKSENLIELTNESDLHNIINNSNKIIVLLFYTSLFENSENETLIKDFDIKSEQFNDCLFIKIKTEEFPTIYEKHIKDIKIPKIVLIHNKNKISLIDEIKDLTNKIIDYQNKLKLFDLPSVEKSSGNSKNIKIKELEVFISSHPVLIFIHGNKSSKFYIDSIDCIKYFKKEKVLYKFFDVSINKEVEETLRSFTNITHFPQIFIKGKYFGDYNYLKKVIKSKKLKEIVPPESITGGLNEKLKKLTIRSEIMLFMKGDPDTPKCKFSREIVSILKNTKGFSNFDSFDILEDNAVREGLKTYSNWKTYPQLYVKGNLIGGLDIVKEMIDEGEFENLLK